MFKQIFHVKLRPELIQSLLNDTMSNVTFTVGMNSRLYFTITLVVLAWLSASTCRAEVTTTNVTTANVTTANVTTANMTTANMTTTNVTTTNVTTATVAPALQYNNTVTPLEVGGVESLKAR